MPPLRTYSLLTILSTTWTILLAFRRRPNFYSAAVFLSRSYGAMLVLYNAALLGMILLGKILVAGFFGELRAMEIERLQERAWFSLTETLLSLTTFREDFGPGFIAILSTLIFVKIFHWLASDRVELMEQGGTLPRYFHVRMVAILSTLWIFDSILLLFTIESILLDGASVMILVASEYMILLTTVWSISMKYGLNIYDSRRATAWEQKSMYFFYIDFITEIFKFITYLSFFCLIVTFYGLPLNLCRDLIVTGFAVFRKGRDLYRYHKATKDMQRRYPTVTEEELSGGRDRTCIICREEMHGAGAEPQREAGREGLNETPKKLPCGHIFHFHCLRSWLERQQSCPTWCVALCSL
ncbi:hypothetical protein BT69DRAFT_1229002 [Atractiella rhizophila]|nr:hypothetical protein BT69DRAFT_1229002 [Atractiella rhizophila]